MNESLKRDDAPFEHFPDDDERRFDRGILMTELNETTGIQQSSLTRALHDSPFMRACRREPVPYTPVWLMRQAGRYMQEYREVRARTSFLELCKTPDLAAEVTITAVERLNVDAAIIFADILLIIEPMGIELEFAKGEGPVIHNPVRTAQDVARLREVESVESLDFVMEAIRRTRRSLRPN